MNQQLSRRGAMLPQHHRCERDDEGGASDEGFVGDPFGHGAIVSCPESPKKGRAAATGIFWFFVFFIDRHFEVAPGGTSA